MSNTLTETIIGAAIEVHRELGPGLLEEVYEKCLCQELMLQGLHFECQTPVPIYYKGITLKQGVGLICLIENSVFVELKSVEKLMPIHEAQLLTDLKLSGKSVGLLINFNEPTLVSGVRRRVV